MSHWSESLTCSRPPTTCNAWPRWTVSGEDLTMSRADDILDIISAGPFFVSCSPRRRPLQPIRSRGSEPHCHVLWDSFRRNCPNGRIGTPCPATPSSHLRGPSVTDSRDQFAEQLPGGAVEFLQFIFPSPCMGLPALQTSKLESVLCLGKTKNYRSG
jgi:hypothetical protein